MEFVMIILEIYDQYVSIQFLDNFHLIFSHLILRSPISLAVSLCSLIRCFAAPPIFICGLVRLKEQDERGQA